MTTIEDVMGRALAYAMDDTGERGTREQLRAAIEQYAAERVAEARKPLNFDQLHGVMSAHFGSHELTDDEKDSAEAFARAIERATAYGSNRMDDLVQRLHSLSRHEHDDLSIGNEAADEIERLRAALRHQDDRDGHITVTIDPSMDELRKSVAEILGEPQTWPEHGNVPLAVGATVALLHAGCGRLEAELERLRGLAERSADMLTAYGELIRRDGASHVEEHHYLPEVEHAARELRECGAGPTSRPPTPVGWSDTDWLRHLETCPPIGYAVRDGLYGTSKAGVLRFCSSDEAGAFAVYASPRPTQTEPSPSTPSQVQVPLTEFKRMQIIGDEFPLALVEPIVIAKVDSVCLAIEKAHGIAAAMAPKGTT